MSDNNQNTTSPEEQQRQNIKDIKNKLGYVSGALFGRVLKASIKYRGNSI
ncbi:MAG: hypothetical protein LN590_06980 [Rickettsia endosymbiont of Glossina mortisans submortisans]|nr:hypothetical protein [Rickettsia endosymbiont of Glossina mortisans submortisans]